MIGCIWVLLSAKWGRGDVQSPRNGLLRERNHYPAAGGTRAARDGERFVSDCRRGTGEDRITPHQPGIVASGGIGLAYFGPRFAVARQGCYACPVVGLVADNEQQFGDCEPSRRRGLPDVGAAGAVGFRGPR